MQGRSSSGYISARPHSGVVRSDHSHQKVRHVCPEWSVQFQCITQRHNGDKCAWHGMCVYKPARRQVLLWTIPTEFHAATDYPGSLSEGAQDCQSTQQDVPSAPLLGEPLRSALLVNVDGDDGPHAARDKAGLRQALTQSLRAAGLAAMRRSTPATETNASPLTQTQTAKASGRMGSKYKSKTDKAELKRG